MNLDRRTFLLGTAAATAFAGCAASRFAPRVRQPGERRRLALIGCGVQMRTALVPMFLNRNYAENVEIVAACDCDSTRAAAGAKLVNTACRNRKCVAVTDFRRILEDPSVDAVCIATPDHWHAYMAVEAMKRGKDVYCETPLAYSVEEAKLVVEAEEKYGCVFRTGSVWRSLREFRDAVGLVRGGFIGDVKYVDANYGTGRKRLGGPSQPFRFYDRPEDAEKEGAPNSDVDWDLWLGPARWRPYSDRLAPRGVHGTPPTFWRFDDDLGSGAHGDCGVNVLDIVQWGLDADASGPCRVLPSRASHSTDPLHGGRRQLGARMMFAKSYGLVELMHCPSGIWSAVFYGTAGIVAVGRGRIAVWRGGLSADVKPDSRVRIALQNANALFAKDDIVVEAVAEGDTNVRRGRLDAALDHIEMEYADVLKHADLRFSPDPVEEFCACLESRVRTSVPAEIGGRVATLTHLLNAAYRYDLGFDWDPERQEIVGDNREGLSFRRDVYRRGWEISLW